MTLYLLFEQPEASARSTASSDFAEAASQDPTKLGLKPGSTLQVEDAIKGIITRSANDAAVVVAEAIAGDEDEFAKLMTRKARALGMSNTVYKNASGLPDGDQITTARDQATLGRAIQERFPKHYKYFSIRSFTFRGESIGNHNHLLGRVEGVDGIKTGYISASGFNLVTSVHRGNRYLVAVVMGGSSAGSRDAKMRELISSKITLASTKRSAPMMAEADAPEATQSEPKVAKIEPRPEPKPEPKVAAKPEKSEPKVAVASATSMPARLTSPPAIAADRMPAARPIDPAGAGQNGDSDGEVVAPRRYRSCRQIARRRPPRPLQRPCLCHRRPSSQNRPKISQVERKPEPASPTQAQDQAKAEPSRTQSEPNRTQDRGQAEPAPSPRSDWARRATSVAVPARRSRSRPGPRLKQRDRSPQRRCPLPAGDSAPRRAGHIAGALGCHGPRRRPLRGRACPMPAKCWLQRWIVQVGAFAAGRRRRSVSTVQTKASKMLDGADPFSETVIRGTTLYRARFAGLTRTGRSRLQASVTTSTA